MARYYEETALIEFVKERTPTINGETTMECVERAIREAPTADVVPKSEVERLKAEKDALIKNYAECMKEVAREIFEEIEQEILSAIDNNLKRMAEQEEANEIWRMCVSKKNALCGIYDFIAELKKKYTESEDKDFERLKKKYIGTEGRNV